MAIIKQSRDWNGIPVKIDTNTETGAVFVYSTLPPFSLALPFGTDALLFRSDGNGNDWVVQAPSVVARLYNQANNTNASPAEIEKAFLTEGRKVFDNDRAAVLNNPDNYDSLRESIVTRQRLAEKKTPLVTDPTTGLTVNGDGEATSLPTTPPQGETTTEGGTIDDAPDTPPGEAVSAPIETAEVAEEEQDSVPITDKTVKAKSDLNISVSSVGLLRYPLANLEAAESLGITYDYIKITIQDWQKSIGGIDESGGAIANSSAVKRYSESKGSLGTIILPMTNNMGSTNGVSWGENNANAIQLALVESVNSFITNVAGAKIEDKFKVIGQEFNRNIQTAQRLIGSVDEKDREAVSALLSGYVVGNTSLATRQSGMVINPNMELLFQGPKLRTFNFTFQFAPRFKAEADVVRQIVKAFKMFSAPEIKQTGAIFLNTPKIFQLDYIYNGDGSDTASGQTHPYLNKIKPCALTSVNVNYTPGGKYMTYADGGSMVQTTMTLSFNELEPIYQSDYTGDNNHPAGY